MAPTMDLLRNDDSTSHYNENQFIGVHRQMAKIPEFTKNETRTFSEAALGCTSISLWSEYALFISDNKGRIHVWVPDYENSRNSEENSAQKSDGIRLEPVQTVYNGNPKYIPYRPMQNIAVDPYGEYLAATDWDGMNYIFKIIQEDYRFKLEEISIENPRPIEKRGRKSGPVLRVVQICLIKCYFLMKIYGSGSRFKLDSLLKLFGFRIVRKRIWVKVFLVSEWQKFSNITFEWKCIHLRKD